MRDRFIVKALRGNEKNIARSCFIWNTIAGGVNAAEAVILMMVITRTNGVEDAGILSIAFALGNLMMTIGKFGVRGYQVTDVKKEYSFNVYYTLRICSVAIMILMAVAYVTIKSFIGGYSYEKALIVLGICLIYAIESFEDVFLGYYQEEGRLDIASKVFIIRWVTIIVLFSIIAYIKNSLLLAVGGSLVISLLCDIYLIAISKKCFLMPPISVDSSKLWKLGKQCFVLCVVSFLSYYVTNAPKYAIDNYLSEDMQAFYGYISMPVFIVELLNCFLYQPYMVDLANEWNGRQFKKFNKRAYRQYIMIFCLTIVCVVGAYLFGSPILSWIYGIGLGQYQNELMMLMLAGGALAFVGYTSVLLTVMRKQNLSLYNMLIITVLAVAGFGKIVQKSGMMGGILYYLFLMILLAGLNYGCVMVIEHRNK